MVFIKPPPYSQFFVSGSVVKLRIDGWKSIDLAPPQGFPRGRGTGCAASTGFAKRLQNYAKSYCGNEALGLDAFQDGIIAIIENLHISGDQLETSPQPLRAEGLQETQAFVAQQLGRLASLLQGEPPQNVELLLARDLDGDSIEELASRFSMTEHGVKSRLKRTRKKLRERLKSFEDN